MKPTLGAFTDGGTAAVDLPRLLETRLLIQANSGAGKSWAIRRLLEQTAGEVQQLVIDPEGEFATLREKHDFVIAAAHDGDALAHPRTAALLARRLLETGVSAILDIYDLKVHERQAFVRLFCEALVNAPKSLWRPCLIVLDEAHVYAPEAGKAESSGAVIDLATRGRKRGYCLVAATQRLAKLHKDAAAELLNKLIGRTGLDVDVKRAADELGMTHREAVAELRNLPSGDFFAFGPAISATVRRVSVGVVKTTHPKAGDRTLKAPPKPTAAIVAVLPKLADLPKEAETEARTIEDLKRELATARRAEAQARPGISSAPANPEELKAAETRGYERGWKAAQEDAAADRRLLKGAIHRAFELAFVDHDRPAPPAPATSAAPRRLPPSPALRKPATNGHAEPQGDLDGPEQKIVNAIARLEMTNGRDEQEQAAVAFLAKYTYGGGSFNNARGRLNGKGLVAYLPGGRIKLTDAGRALAETPDAPLTAEELHRSAFEVIDTPMQRVLKPLLEAYPDAMAGPDVADAAGYTHGAGSFNNARGRLRSLGLIEYVGDGRLKAADALFPEVRHG